MANRPLSHRDYRLSWLHEEACAVKGSGANRQRYRLGVFRTPGDGGKGEEAAWSALVSFADNEAKAGTKSDGTIGALWKAYVESREKDDKVMTPFTSVWKHLEPFFSHTTVDELNEDLCRAYATQRFATGKGRAGHGVSNNTVWTELNKLASCISWGVAKGFITGKSDKWSPVWKPSTTERREEVLVPADVRSLLDACFFDVDTETQGTQRYELWHLYFFVILMMCTGGRPTAVLQLTGDRCDFNKGLIDLRKKREHNPMSKRKMKNRAVVNMNDLARSTLLQAKAMIEASGGEWEKSTVIQWRGGSIDRVSKGFRALVERAKLPAWVSPHKLRHAVATWVDDHGLEAGTILGHAKGSKATAIYVHPTGKKTKAATEVVDRALGIKRLRSV